MSDPADVVFDVGLQAERTALAWQRTGLAVAVGSVAAERLAAPVLGGVSLAFAAVGLLLAVVVMAGARRRYRAVHESLSTRGDLTAVGSSAAPIAALACAGLLVALLALAFVLVP